MGFELKQSASSCLVTGRGERTSLFPDHPQASPWATSLGPNVPQAPLLSVHVDLLGKGCVQALAAVHDFS